MGGSTYLVSKDIVANSDPFTATSLRFLVAAVSILPFYFTSPRSSLKTISSGVLVGLTLAFGIITLYIGLGNSRSGMASLIVNTDFLLIPLLNYLIFEKVIARRFACCFAASGLLSSYFVRQHSAVKLTLFSFIAVVAVSWALSPAGFSAPQLMNAKGISALLYLGVMTTSLRFFMS